MARNIGEEQAADATGRAARDIVDIAAMLSLAKWLTIDPDIETGQFDSTGRELTTSPDLHALHVLCGGIRHRSIITAQRELNDSMLLSSGVFELRASLSLGTVVDQPESQQERGRISPASAGAYARKLSRRGTCLVKSNQSLNIFFSASCF